MSDDKPIVDNAEDYAYTKGEIVLRHYITELEKKLKNAKNCQLWGVCENQWVEIKELKGFVFNQSDDKWQVIKNIEGALREFIAAYEMESMVDTGLLDKLGGEKQQEVGVAVRGASEKNKGSPSIDSKPPSIKCDEYDCGICQVGLVQTCKYHPTCMVPKEEAMPYANGQAGSARQTEILMDGSGFELIEVRKADLEWLFKQVGYYHEQLRRKNLSIDADVDKRFFLMGTYLEEDHE